MLPSLSTASRREDVNRVVFHVELFCTVSSQTSNHTISFSDLPKTGLSIKENVEDQFSIPVCVQSLDYDAGPLSDDANLEQLRIRSGDRFVVRYSSKGDCKGIKEVISWFADVRMHLHGEKPSIFRPLSKTFEEVLILGRGPKENGFSISVSMARCKDIC